MSKERAIYSIFRCNLRCRFVLLLLLLKVYWQIGGYVRYISPYIIIIIKLLLQNKTELQQFYIKIHI